jgi:hypothetical protein
MARAVTGGGYGDAVSIWRGLIVRTFPVHPSRGVLAVAVTAVLLSACGGSSGSSGADTDGGDAARPGDQLTAGQLSTVLLQPADLPSGYQLDNSEDDDEDTDFGTSDCARKLEEFSADDSSAAEVERAFSAGEDGLSGLEQSASAHPDEDALDASIDEFRDIISGCDQITFSADGVPATLKVSQADVPEHGDDTLGVRMKGQIAAFPFEIVIGVNRLGHNLHMVSAGGLGEADMTALETAMNLGFERLEKAHETDPDAPVASAAPEPDPQSTLRTGGPGTYTGSTDDGVQVELTLPAPEQTPLAAQTLDYLEQVGGEFAGTVLVNVTVSNDSAEQVYLSGVTVVTSDGEQVELQDMIDLLNETYDADLDAYNRAGGDLNDQFSEQQISGLKPNAKASQLYALRTVDPAAVQDVYVSVGGEDVQLGLK